MAFQRLIFLRRNAFHPHWCRLLVQTSQARRRCLCCTGILGPQRHHSWKHLVWIAIRRRAISERYLYWSNNQVSELSFIMFRIFTSYLAMRFGERSSALWGWRLYWSRRKGANVEVRRMRHHPLARLTLLTNKPSGGQKVCDSIDVRTSLSDRLFLECSRHPCKGSIFACTDLATWRCPSCPWCSHVCLLTDLPKWV